MKLSILSILLIESISFQVCAREDFVFSYPITINRVIDGDTFQADIHLSSEITLLNQRIRLLGVDAYEKKDLSGKGLEAKEVAQTFLFDGFMTLKWPGKRDSFGRILANVHNEKGVLLNDILIKKNLVTKRYR